jgi:hypothetical protein
LYAPRLATVDTENPIRPLDACTYETYSLIPLADFAYPDFVTLLLVYGSLPFSPYTCTLIPCPSCGTVGGNPLEEIGFGYGQTSEEDSGSGQSTQTSVFATQPKFLSWEYSCGRMDSRFEKPGAKMSQFGALPELNL